MYNRKQSIRVIVRASGQLEFQISSIVLSVRASSITDIRLEIVACIRRTKRKRGIEASQQTGKDRSVLGA